MLVGTQAPWLTTCVADVVRHVVHSRMMSCTSVLCAHTWHPGDERVCITATARGAIAATARRAQGMHRAATSCPPALPALSSTYVIYTWVLVHVLLAFVLVAA